MRIIQNARILGKPQRGGIAKSFAQTTKVSPHARKAQRLDPRTANKPTRIHARRVKADNFALPPPAAAAGIVLGPFDGRRSTDGTGARPGKIDGTMPILGTMQHRSRRPVNETAGNFSSYISSVLSNGTKRSWNKMSDKRLELGCSESRESSVGPKASPCLCQKNVLI